jgi:hypothetical protein
VSFSRKRENRTYRNMRKNDISRLGGLRRVELYGNPGTLEGRSRGGKKTVFLFSRHPALAKAAGFTIRKQIKYPRRSVELAEFIGIMLGDGGLPGNHQLTITFDRKTDRKYANYICTLVKRLFAVGYFMRRRKDSRGADIVISSSNLVDFLLRQGLVKGNKVKNQVAVPRWICRNERYATACLRGLMDTDGSLYAHTYKRQAKIYKYPKLCFCNYSKPLLHFVCQILKKLNYSAYLSASHVSVYSLPEVKKYFQRIGTHNPKHRNKFLKYFMNCN